MLRTALLLPLLLASLSGCASVRPNDAASTAITLTLRPGEETALADHGRLRYVRVVSDSRCPPDVQCVHAGDAEVLFEYTVAEATTPLILSRATPSRPLGQRWLHLLQLDFGAAPTATVRIDATPPAARP